MSLRDKSDSCGVCCSNYPFNLRKGAGRRGFGGWVISGQQEIFP